MTLHLRSALALSAVAAICAACQAPDVGARCDIEWNVDNLVEFPRPEPQSIPGDYLETGNTTCDSLVCIVSPAPSGEYSRCAGDHTQCGYCSKPCVSDAECYTKETGLVCRDMVLDEAYIKYLEGQTVVDGDGHTHTLAELYLGDARYSRYCAAPL